MSALNGSRDGEVNVENLMQTIRDNVKMRKKKANISEIGSKRKSFYTSDNQGLDCKDLIQKDIMAINKNWDVRNDNYIINSHRPFIGKILTSARRLIHGEIQRYVNPSIWKQTQFNESNVRIIQELQREIQELQRENEMINEKLNQSIILMERDISSLRDICESQVEDKVTNLSRQILSLKQQMTEEKQ